MTVNELIEKLKEFPGDLPVAVECDLDGGGYDLVFEGDFKVIKVSAYSGGGGSYYGELVKYEDGNENKTYQAHSKADPRVLETHPMFDGHFDVLVLW